MPYKVRCFDKRGSSELMSLGHKLNVSLIMAGGFQTVVTNHDFLHFLTEVDEVREAREMSCY